MATLAVPEQHFAPRWQALHGRRTLPAATPSLRHLGRHWVERLAWQAREWRHTHSPRQVERRIRAYSGRSLRQWQALVRTEGLFFAARERHDAGRPFDWVALAQDEGFADQAHLSRAAKRITGFSPGESARRFAEDESFLAVPAVGVTRALRHALGRKRKRQAGGLHIGSIQPGNRISCRSAA